MAEHDWSPELRRRLADLRLPPELEASIVEELAQHLDDRRQALIVAGSDPADATALVREELDRARLLEAQLATLRRARGGSSPHHRTRPAGGLWSVVSSLNERRGSPWLAGLGRDLRHEARLLRRRPDFTAAAILTLALGISANAAVFAVLHSVLIRPLPFPEPDALVAVWHVAPGAPGLASVSGDLRLSGSMYFTYAEHNRSFQALGLWYLGQATVTGDGEPERVRTLPVTAGTLQALGMPPHTGRWLSDADQLPSSAPTVMLGHGYWRRRFGSDGSILGRVLTVDSRPREIVGVMPAGFRMGNQEPDLIVPMALDRSQQRLPGFSFQAVARLKPGTTIADASTDVARMVPLWMRSWPAAQGVDPAAYEAWRIAPAIRPLKDDVVGNAGGALWALMGTVGLVMIVVCANVATLLLVRADARQQEFAVRAALGAAPAGIVRALFCESAWLAAGGSVLGVALAAWWLRILVANAPAGLPRVHEIGIDPATMLFTLGLALATAFVCGLVPALRHSAGLGAALRAGGRLATISRQRQRARHTLVVCQVALALVLLVTSALMVRSARALRDVDPGLADMKALQAVRLSIPSSLVGDAEAVARAQQRLVDAVRAIPGVDGAAVVNALPMEGGGSDWDILEAEGVVTPSGEIPPVRLFKYVSPGFFAVAGMHLAAGRDLSWTDLYGRRPVAIVSSNLARENWGSAAAALGRRIRTLPGLPWREIIGVVNDVHENGPHEPPPSIVYWPSFGEGLYRSGSLNSIRTFTLVARSERTGTEAFLAEIRRAIWSVNDRLPATTVQTMEEIYERSMARTSMTTALFALSGTASLLLSIVGLVGTISYGASQRTREIGIRIALGAGRGDVRRMFVRQGLTLALTGATIGTVAALLVTRGLSPLLFGVDARDPAAFAAAAGILVLSTLLASYLPAARAARVDPSLALRAE